MWKTVCVLNFPLLSRYIFYVVNEIFYLKRKTFNKIILVKQKEQVVNQVFWLFLIRLFYDSTFKHLV